MPLRSSAAKRYAEAIAGIARQESTWEQWRQDLATVGRAIEDRALRMALESPRISLERKQALLRAALGADVLAPQTSNLLTMLARRRRFDLLPDVIAWFDELSDRALGVRRYTVTSARPLAADERQRLTARLGAGQGQVVLTEKVDPAILGGLMLQEGDIIRDYSVRARLDSLRERMN